MNTTSVSENGGTVIVVPMYRSGMTADERKSLEQVFRILGNHPIVAVLPESLDISGIQKDFPSLETERFDDSFFKGIKAYNRLVLDPSFYRRFGQYGYMLIYQLDAYVFSDQLDHWTDRGFDYVGAPWIPMKEKYFSRRKRIRIAYNRRFRKNSPQKPHHTHYFSVGNGGFSLRKIETFIRLTEHYAPQIREDLNQPGPICPEDLWLLFNPKGEYKLKVPYWKDALGFSFEQNPGKSFVLNGYKLPFGCHAWYHPDYEYFWKGRI